MIKLSASKNENSSHYVILLKAINKFISSGKIIGFCDNFEEASYVFETIHTKTFYAKGDYVYTTEPLIVYGEIKDAVNIVCIDTYKTVLNIPICGFESYTDAQNKAKEIQENQPEYCCTVDYVEKWDKQKVDKFQKPPECAWA